MWGDETSGAEGPIDKLFRTWKGESDVYRPYGFFESTETVTTILLWCIYIECVYIDIGKSAFIFISPHIVNWILLLKTNGKVSHYETDSYPYSNVPILHKEGTVRIKGYTKSLTLVTVRSQLSLNKWMNFL